MPTTSRPGGDEYASSLAGYVARISDDEDIVNNQPISVRALAYVIAGHTRHHLEVVEARYLG
jgi:hypothetical protein